MSSKMSILEEIKEQQQKTKDMTLKGKLSYFWYYYKVQTIVIILVLLFIISFIRQIMTDKPYAFYAVLLNADNTPENIDTSFLWEDEFQTYAEIDADSYQVSIDTSITLSSDGGSQYDAANRQKMTAMMHVGDIHALLADTETFESYARLEFFYDLTSVFTDEDLAPYADYLYYTDAAAFDEDTGDTLEEMESAAKEIYERNIDHGDPSTMEKPVAVGIRIPGTGNKLAESGYYAYLQEESRTFQGYPEETVIGIPVSVENPHLALKFLEYLMQ